MNRRHDFPMLKTKLIYFDSAATSLKPQCVINAMNHFYENNYGTVHRAIYDLSKRATDAYQNVRKKVAKFINAAHAEEIVFTRGTTESINLIARSFIKPGDEIILSEIEHHSNIVPWQMAGASIKFIPVNDKGELMLDAFKELLSSKTKLVSLAHISNALGTVHLIKEIIKMAHAVGAKVAIDGAQAAPHLKVDVQDLDVDFYSFSSHKMYGPTGVGILYGKAELLDKMPPFFGGGDMIDKVTLESSTFAKAPMKFEAGTPMIAEVIGLGTAIDYLNEIGLDKISKHENDLLKYATAKLELVPKLKIIGTAHEKGAIISFVIDGIHHLDIGTLLDLKGVAIRTGHHCAQPAMRRFGVSGTSRVSFGLYNTKEEIDIFVNHLQDIVAKWI